MKLFEVIKQSEKTCISQSTNHCHSVHTVTLILLCELQIFGCRCLPCTPDQQHFTIQLGVRSQRWRSASNLAFQRQRAKLIWNLEIAHSWGSLSSLSSTTFPWPTGYRTTALAKAKLELQYRSHAARAPSSSASLLHATVFRHCAAAFAKAKLELQY